MASTNGENDVFVQEVDQLKAEKLRLTKETEDYKTVQCYLENKLRSVEHENYDLMSLRVEKMAEQSANPEDIDKLKKNFDQSRDIMLHQISHLNKKIELLEKDNADLKQQKINYMDDVASSTANLQQEVHKRLNEIAEEIAGHQRKHPRLNNDVVNSDVQSTELAKLNEQISSLKDYIVKKEADFATLNKQASALESISKEKHEKIEQLEMELAKAKEVHKTDCMTLMGKIDGLKIQNTIDHLVQDGRFFAVDLKNDLLKENLEEDDIITYQDEVDQRLNAAIQQIEQNARKFIVDGNFVEAIKLYSGIAGMASTKSRNKRAAADAWISIGRCFDEQEKYAAAIESYVKAIEICREYFKPYYYCARDHLKLGDIKEAQLNVTKCLEIRPDFREAINLLAMIIDQVRAPRN